MTTDNTITLPRSVAMQALEALKIGHESAHDCAETFHIEMAGYKQQRHEALDAEVKQISDAIDALRAALEQEPEAWDNCRGERQCRIWCGNKHCVSHPAPQPPAVEQPQGEQEPVGCVAGTYGGYPVVRLINPALVLPFGTALYTHPQPKREPLTDEQINDHRLALPYDGEDLPDPWDFKQGVRAAERAHGIGGEA